MQNVLRRWGIVLCLLLSFTALAGYPEFPYPATDYLEPYRGQFHFTSQAGWMNDINGVWYSDGVYHLAYQHNPHGTGWDQMHWGHATSTDLIHWEQQPIMLEPGVNVPGDCFSGSTVVDIANTSGLQTGANPLFVTIYTATGSGTCLAYSNDLGQTWQAYASNPVNVGGSGAGTRDPHVFWHAATSKWVCALYEDGITFYTSPDLKTWTKTSNFAWGYECPDIYELPVDENPSNTKWVLQDAAGAYYIGQFDGETFIPQAGGPYQMDEGPNFYAAQTFYQPSLPDSRVIQLAWMTGGLDTSPWNKSASFPVQLQLKTTADGVRLFRTPITEISSIYGTAQTWGTQTLSSGVNLLSGIESKCYDLTAEFDLAGATASTITFQLANKTVTYDITNQQLLGKTLSPIGNKIKIRILADWNQLEVFGNDGLFSWTESFAFTPENSSLSLTANGDVNLSAMEFHPVNRIWPFTEMEKVFNTNLTGPWSAVSGSWNICSEGAWGANTSDAFYLNSSTGGDFTYEGDLKVLSGVAGALVFRANADATQGYCVNIDTHGVVKLWGPGRGALAEAAATIEVGVTYHLKVVTQGANIKVYFDHGSTPIIDYTDASPILSGTFGLNVYASSTIFQNVYASDHVPSFRTNLTGNWSAVGGTWNATAEGEQGVCDGNGFFINTQTCGDLTYEGDIKVVTGVAGALVFRANASCSQAYCVNIDTGSNVVKLWDPMRGALAEYGTTIEVGAVYHLKVIATGANIKVYLNSDATPVIDYTDASPILSGQLGLNVFAATSIFQDVYLESETPCSISSLELE